MTRLYPAMAATNIKNNRRTFIPYMITSILTVAIFYIVCSLADNQDMANIWGGNIIQSYMNMGQVIVSMFAVIFLFYINSFLTKRRKSEFGLYNILGMEKRHIAKVIGIETLYVFLIVMVFGILVGVLLDRLMYLIIMRLFHAAIPLGFYISSSAISKSFTLFGIIFILMLISSMYQVRKAKPVELLRSGNVGEREPKARWFIALVGFICLVSGYVIAVTTKNPVAAFMLFFVAVILVIIGTYLVFTAGSVALLKILRKNKGYYYKTKHFISVSGMMYRMKRNAVGLANICILSTMVLVMISAVLSLYLGLDDSFQKRYPRELSITAMADDPTVERNIQILEQTMQDEGMTIIDPVQYRELSFTTVYEEETKEFVVNPDIKNMTSSISAYNRLKTLIFVPLEDYNEAMGTSETLADGEVLMYSPKQALSTDTFRLLGQTFTVKKTLDDFMENNDLQAVLTSGCFIVVRDMDVMNEINSGQQEAFGKYSSYIQTSYMADLALGAKKGELVTAAKTDKDEKMREEVVAAYEKVRKKIYEEETTAAVICRSLEQKDYGMDFTGLFFIGIFLGLLFVMATVLIMYYKQITEGYEDKERFEILQNVGMSHQEVRKAISSQILIVFFLPLVTAGIHVAFAFPFMSRIMMLFSLFNFGLFARCTAACFLVFGIFYTIVYLLTARLYYGIVKK